MYYNVKVSQKNVILSHFNVTVFTSCDSLVVLRAHIIPKAN